METRKKINIAKVMMSYIDLEILVFLLLLFPLCGHEEEGNPDIPEEWWPD